MLQGHILKEEALLTVRSRIRFADRIRDRYGVIPPIEVAYDDFTEDIELNRILKAGTDRLARIRLRHPQSRQALREIDAVLVKVSRVEYSRTQLSQFSWNRLNERYQPAVELAKMIIRNTTPEIEPGRRRSSALLVDMNDVFQRLCGSRSERRWGSVSGCSRSKPRPASCTSTPRSASGSSPTCHGGRADGASGSEMPSKNGSPSKE